MSAQQAIAKQIIDMQAAIDILTESVDELTGSIDPDNATWRDVAEFAMQADAARDLIERLRG